MNYLVLAAFRNRREKTLRFVSSVLEATVAPARIEVMLFDDGSSDGTAEAVTAAFPAVRIVKGTGSAYWNGAMTVLMDSAMKRRDIDSILIANDDIELEPGALERAFTLFEETNADDGPAAIVGAFHDGAGTTTYSGFARLPGRGPGALKLVEPHDAPVPCSTFNGNFVLLPVEACRAVGGIDGRFLHSGGDVDLGYRLAAGGVKLVIAPGYLGRCDRGPSFAERAGRLSFPERVKFVFGPVRSPRDVALLSFKHGGVLAPALIVKDLLFRARIILWGR